MKTKILLLVSGNLGFKILINLVNILDIEFIATDKNSKEIIDFATFKKIPLFIGSPRRGKLLSFIENFEGELLLSINYLFLIEEDVIRKFKYPINFHGSLLPKYRGRTPHVWSIINNEIETGVTAHFIDSGCDTGDIILQKKVPIAPNDTGHSILEKYGLLYPVMVKEIIDLYNTGKGMPRSIQKNSIATTYGKRSPDDGHINWDWQKERIRNWVRAQSFPYPGAFTFYGEKKITIDKVSFCEAGFNNEIKNGTILKTDPGLIIKTSNGAILIEEIREHEVAFVKNKILS